MSAVATNKLNQLSAKLAGLGQPKDSQKANDAKGDYKQSNFWVNVGYQDEAEGFITLPYNLPIEHMKPRDLSGSNADYIVKAELKNELLSLLQQMAQQLEPGETLDLDLKVQLYRSEEREAVANSSDVQARLDAARQRRSSIGFA